MVTTHLVVVATHLVVVATHLVVVATHPVVVATHLVEEPLSDVWVGYLHLLHKVSWHQSRLTLECSSVVSIAVHSSVYSNHGTLMEVSVIALS